MQKRSPRERLYWLVDLLLANELPMRDFLREFEWTYTNELATGDLDTDEEQNFGKLFKVASWHGTAEDRLSEPLPVRTSDEDVRSAAAQAKAALRRRLT